MFMCATQVLTDENFASQPQLFQCRDGSLVNSLINEVHLKDYGIDVTQGVHISTVPNSEISSDSDTDVDVENLSLTPLLDKMFNGLIPSPPKLAKLKASQLEFYVPTSTKQLGYANT